MELSNREWAYLVWVVAFIGYALIKDKKRQLAAGIRNILCAFFEPKIFIVLAFASIWITFCVCMLHYIGAWEISNIKTTLLWAVTFAFVTLFDIGRISEDEIYFRKTVRDTLGAMAAITFIAESYSFSFAIELILIPFLVVITGIHILSEKKPEHASVHKLAGAILAVIGVVYIGYGLYMAGNDFQAFATLNTLRDFLLPIILSLLFLPFLYVVSVIVSYELTFVRLHWALKDSDLRRYAAFWAIINFRFDLKGLRRWKRHIGIFPPENRKDIKNSIAEIKQNQRTERDPPSISPDQGWCPIAATKFLAAFELPAGDYHRIDNDQWWASSLVKELDTAAILPDNIAYYIEGDKTAAKRIIVKLHVNDRQTGAASDFEFRKICSALLDIIAESIPHAQQEKILQSDTIDVEAAGRRIRLRKEDFLNPSQGYSRTMTVDHSPEYRDPYEIVQDNL